MEMIHYSSSGLDLPMKVVDMFGTGLPVCQVDYKCIDELVQHRKNGFIFKDAKELSSNIQELLQDFPQKKGVLGQMKGHLEVFRARKWEQEWAEVAASVFDSLGGGKKAPKGKKLLEEKIDVLDSLGLGHWVAHAKDDLARRYPSASPPL